MYLAHSLPSFFDVGSATSYLGLGYGGKTLTTGPVISSSLHIFY